MKTYLRPLAACLFALSMLATSCGNGSETTRDTSAVDATAADDTGVTTAVAAPSADDKPDHSDHTETIDIPDGVAVPAITVKAEPDSVTGHNLTVELENFELAPKSASTEPVNGEGHLHFYIDGEPTMRFYNPALHVTGLSEGEHELTVEVSANNHSPYSIEGEAIQATVTVEVGSDDSGHEHKADKPLFEPDDAPRLNSVEVTKDPKAGWNVYADISNFVFSPESVGGEPTASRGHLHLLIDGQKVARLYGPWWHIPQLEEGAHTVEIEVVADDHSRYGVDGKPVSAATSIEVTDSDASGSDHAHSPADDSGGHSNSMKEDMG